MNQLPIRAVFFAMLGLLAGVAAGQLTQSPAEDMTERLLGRQISVVGQEELSSPAAFKLTLNRAKVPGGIIVVPDCSTPPKYAVSQGGSSLRDTLQAIVTADPRYEWRVTGGVINLIPRDGVPAFLETRLVKFKAENVGTVAEALAKLLAMPEVQKSISQHDLGPQMLRGGVGYFEPARSDSAGNSRTFTVVLENVIIRDVLNAIAQAHGTAVWSYSEYRCRSKAFSLAFLPQ